MTDIARAKRIIIEIIRQAGGTLENKTNLFKAFYFSHLIYAEGQAGYLSNYPIVRMPNGPGIERATDLLDQLVADGVLHIDTVNKGDFEAFCFHLTEATPTGGLPQSAIASIKSGVDRVVGKTATQASDISHRQSRSWRNAEDGEEIDIYLDSLSDDEYEALMSTTKRNAEAFDVAWNSL